MRFKQYLQDNPVVLESNPGYVRGATYSGPLALPDISLGHVYDIPGQAPAGGYTGIGQMTHSMIDKHRYADREKYQKLMALQKIGIMANNIVIVCRQNDKAKENMTARYRLARENGHFISGLPLRGLFVDGGYPELRASDIDIGERLGVIVPDPNPPDPHEMERNGINPEYKMLAINVDTLRTQMEEMYKEMSEMERQYKAIGYLGGEADKAWGYATNPGKMTQSKGVNPLSGS